MSDNPFDKDARTGREQPNASEAPPAREHAATFVVPAFARISVLLRVEPLQLREQFVKVPRRRPLSPPVGASRLSRVAAGREPFADLLEIVGELGATERAVLRLVAERLLMGQQRYGRLDVATDRRDFARESLEEAADGFAYAAMALMRGRTR